MREHVVYYGLGEVSMTTDDISNDQIVIKVIFDFCSGNTRECEGK